jgi:tRNA U54 and U55 pseudouridine synthase Pus10
VSAEREFPSPPRKARASVYLESRYRKLERGLPQTIFYCPDCKGHRRRRKNCRRCDGYGKLTKDSVQELIARHLLPAYRARSGEFHGAGREDLDVRMLGHGRPFVFEVVGPRARGVDLEEIHRMEWISGDEGRTRPSLADEVSVGCRCDALDVLEIVTE